MNLILIRMFSPQGRIVRSTRAAARPAPPAAASRVPRGRSPCTSPPTPRSHPPRLPALHAGPTHPARRPRDARRHQRRRDVRTQRRHRPRGVQRPLAPAVRLAPAPRHHVRVAVGRRRRPRAAVLRVCPRTSREARAVRPRRTTRFRGPWSLGSGTARP